MNRTIPFVALILLLLSGCNLRDTATSGGDTGEDSDGADAACLADETETCGDNECVDVQTDVEHCGSCGNDCVADPRNVTCVESTCEAGMCAFTAADNGTSCTREGGEFGVCASSECVECITDDECVDPPTSHTDCWEGTCSADNSCEYEVPDPQKPCGRPTCSDGLFREPDLCGEAGSCNLRDPGTDCAPYVCNEAGDACTTSCSEDSGCAGGVPCSESECLSELPVDITIAADAQDVRVSTLIVDEYGWNETIPVVGTITVAEGAAVGSTDTSTPAMTVESLPEESDLTMRVEGMILGAGGDGGDVLANGGQPSGFNDPGDGGTALLIESQPQNAVLRIENNGIIGGGGGGGAGGSTFFINIGITLGGGGGAGFAPGAGGGGAPSAQISKDGADGTLEQGGAGGRNEGAGGGRGGHLGQRGGPVDDLQQSSSRGDAGTAVLGASHVEWTRQGDVRGSMLP